MSSQGKKIRALIEKAKISQPRVTTQDLENNFMNLNIVSANNFPSNNYFAIQLLAADESFNTNVIKWSN